MANPDISLLGATYSGVSGVTLPKQGGGSATFPWVEGSQTITENGTYDVSALAEAIVNVSGGGGASNFVTGTFKGTTAGAIDVNLDYSGNGYPLAVLIYPDEGAYKTGGSYLPVVHMNAIDIYTIIKQDISVPPRYRDFSPDDSTSIMYAYKSSDSNGIPHRFNGNMSARSFNDANAEVGTSYLVKIRSNKKMSVFIAGTGYGFLPDIDYRYIVFYSG